MEVLLLRHGIACDGEPDASRPLSPAGRQRTAAVLQRLVALELHCGRLYSSPLLRARQTAELALAAGLAPELQQADPLAPGGEALVWLQQQAAVDGANAVQRLGLVGHEPGLSHLAAALMGAPAGSLQLKKAGVILLRWPGATGLACLRWLASPKLLLP